MIGRNFHKTGPPCSMGLIGLIALIFVLPTLSMVRGGETIVEQWSRVQAPPPVALKAVQINPQETAFLILDIEQLTCNPDRRPRCIASVPEPIVQSSVDKFFKTDLDKIIRGKDIKTVIIAGTTAEGAVLHTATGAAMRGTMCLSRWTVCRPETCTRNNTRPGI